jgi:hypothetical protein
MILPNEQTETTLRERLERVVLNQNPTVTHELGL